MSRGAGRRTVLGLCFAVFGVCGVGQPGAAVEWQQLEPGLEYAEVLSPIAAPAGDSRIRLLRIDPTRFSLELLNASASPDGGLQTAKQWAQSHGLVAAINASLYQADYRTSVSLMRSRRHTNNARVSKHNAVLLFDRLDDGVPPVQIVDRTCRDLNGLRDRYGAMVQNIRMISCQRVNVWSKQPQAWSSAAVGMDDGGRALFIHMRAPLSTHDLVNALLALPIGLRETMYVEGGPEAQLYIDAGGRQIEVVGSHGSSFAGIENSLALPIPNVLGVRRTAAGAAAASPAGP